MLEAKQLTSEQTIVSKEMANITATKTIGLISDTHIPSRAQALPREVFTSFENVDFIIHAGDLVELSVIDELEQIAPVLAVRGNMDGPETIGVLPNLNSLKIFDRKIGVIHDPDILFGMDRMRELTKANGFDVLVYGHTHNANIKWDEKILYINPGSPTNPSPLLNKPSVALLKITKDLITPEIIRI
ncbi:MAG: metallophosphoesterase [Candidatus Bathyarchaeota archaeon]|nr:metallophosphoesterase [Candidatus Termiticorpusculum sp.]